MSFDTATPYIASYIIIRNSEGKIGFVLRSNTGWMNGYYGLPSGKVEKNEAYSAAAIREAKEEIGIDVDHESLKFAHAMHRNEGMEWVDVYFETKSWDGEPYNAEPHVHGEFRWLDPTSLPENVVPSVRSALEKIKQNITYSEYGWEAQTT